uniref:Uncharacterized protein n=1 Tax=Xiphophorus couchianus TaxID=32473 RepID=A0A3B5KY46_9TELE
MDYGFVDCHCHISAPEFQQVRLKIRQQPAISYRLIAERSNQMNSIDQNEAETINRL